MQHALAHTTNVGDEAPSTEPGGDDDDLSSQANIESVAGADEVLDVLPSRGYYIFNERPSTTVPLVNSTYDDVIQGYISYAPPILGNGDLSRLRISFFSACKRIARNWSNFMLVFVPIGILAPLLDCSDSAVFVLNCLAIIPLADVLCRATDDVASFLGDTAGALINVTMGNATELVIFQALVQRQYMIVRTSLLGSIIVNTLLVLGLAIFTGEIQERGQVYNVLATRVAAVLLCLTTVSLIVPSTLKTSEDDRLLKRDILDLSRGTSIVLIVVYLIYLWTQIRSTKFSYKPLIQLDDGPDGPDMNEVVELYRPSFHRRTFSYPRTSLIPPTLSDLEGQRPRFIDDIEIRSFPGLAFVKSFSSKIWVALELAKCVAWIRRSIPIALLMVSTGLISICGNYLVNSIDHFVDHSPISKTMVGLIVLPIVGNAAELVSGIMFASRKQMDLAFAVAIGSAIQIALFVTPLVVLMGWTMGREMSLHFTPFETITLTASTMLFFSLIFDERCSSVKAACLFAGYTVIGLASYFIPNVE